MGQASSSITLGTDIDTHQPVKLEGESKDLGLYIIGTPGVGKSTLMLNMVLQDISQGNGVCVLDPHGDLINDILARSSDVDPDKFIILDLENWQHPFGLNLFQCNDVRDPTARSRTASYVMGIFEKLWGDDGLHPSWGAQLEDILRHICQTFVHAQKYTLVDVPLFLEDESFRDSVIANLSPQIQDYWERSYNPRKDQITYRASTLNKVRKFTDNELLYPILGQSVSTINFAEAMEEQKIILASLPEGKIGDEAVTLLGSLIIGQILQATLARTVQPQHERLPFSLYCDEYYYFATTDFPRFFAEGRKFKVSTVIAHQGRYQLDTISKQATLNVANRVVFRVSGKDAQEFRHEFNYTPPKPRQLVVKEPFDVLLRKQHANSNVNEFILKFAAILEEAKKKPYLKFEAEYCIELINNLLYGLMTRKVSSDSLAAKDQLFLILQSASIFYSHDNYKIVRGQEYKSVEDAIKRAIPGFWDFSGRENTVRRQYLYRLARIADAYITHHSDKDGLQVLWDELNGYSSHHYSSARLKHHEFRKWCDEFMATAEYLIQSPIYDSSILDAPTGDPKTSDIVALLSNFDRYYARYRLQVGGSINEGTMKTLEPLQEKSRKPISPDSRESYTIPLEDVFTQIRKRQRGDDATPTGARKPRGIDEE